MKLKLELEIDGVREVSTVELDDDEVDKLLDVADRLDVPVAVAVFVMFFDVLEVYYDKLDELEPVRDWQKYYEFEKNY